MKHRYQPVRCNGLRYFGGCGHPDAYPLLYAARSDHDRSVRGYAMDALASLGDVDGLLKTLSD